MEKKWTNKIMHKNVIWRFFCCFLLFYCFCYCCAAAAAATAPFLLLKSVQNCFEFLFAIPFALFALLTHFALSLNSSERNRTKQANSLNILRLTVWLPSHCPCHLYIMHCFSHECVYVWVPFCKSLFGASHVQASLTIQSISITKNSYLLKNICVQFEHFTQKCTKFSNSNCW